MKNSKFLILLMPVFLMVSCSKAPSGGVVNLTPEKTIPKTDPKKDNSKADLSDDDELWPSTMKNLTLLCENPRTSNRNSPSLLRGTGLSNEEAGLRVLRWTLEGGDLLPLDLRRITVLNSKILFAQIAKYKTENAGIGFQNALAFLENWSNTKSQWKVWTELPSRSFWTLAGQENIFPEVVRRSPWVVKASEDTLLMPVKGRDFWGVYKLKDSSHPETPSNLVLKRGFENLKLDRSQLVYADAKRAYFNLFNSRTNRFQVLKLNLESWSLIDVTGRRKSALMLGFLKSPEALLYGVQIRDNSWRIESTAGASMETFKEVQNVRAFESPKIESAVAVVQRATHIEFLDASLKNVAQIKLPLGEWEFLNIESLPSFPDYAYVELKSDEELLKSETFLLHLPTQTWRGPMGRRSCTHPVLF